MNRIIALSGIALMGAGSLAGCSSSDSSSAEDPGTVEEVVVENSAIEDAVDTCDASTESGVDVGDGGRTLLIDTKGEEDAFGANIASVACLLNELDVSDAVISRIDSTRALDGRQEGGWGDYTASWGYHPDSGLDLVIELQESD